MNRRIFEQTDVPAHVERRLLRLEARVDALTAVVRILADAAMLDADRVDSLLRSDSRRRAEIKPLWTIPPCQPSASAPPGTCSGR